MESSQIWITNPMLKMYANGTRDGKPVRLVVIGLSHRNLDLLREGKPIKIRGDAIGLKKAIEVMIFAGETEQTMMREFSQFIGPDTKLSIDPRLKS